MKTNEVKIFKKIVIFGIEQQLIYLKVKKSEYEKNKEIQEKSERVYKENLIVMEEEIIHISKTREFIKKLNESEFIDNINFKEKLLQDIKKIYLEQGAPMVCYVIVSEKIESCLNFYNEIFRA